MAESVGNWLCPLEAFFFHLDVQLQHFLSQLTCMWHGTVWTSSFYLYCLVLQFLFLSPLMSLSLSHSLSLALFFFIFQHLSYICKTHQTCWILLLVSFLVSVFPENLPAFPCSCSIRTPHVESCKGFRILSCSQDNNLSLFFSQCQNPLIRHHTSYVWTVPDVIKWASWLVTSVRVLVYFASYSLTTVLLLKLELY